MENLKTAPLFLLMMFVGCSLAQNNTTSAPEPTTTDAGMNETTTISGGNGTTSANSGNETTMAALGNETTTAVPTTVAGDNETATATTGNETTTAGAGNDTTTVAGGNDTTTSAPGNETTTAVAGNENTTAAAGNYTTTAAGGNDTTTAAGGNDTTTAAGGNETNTPAGGNETTTSVAGNETTTMSAGNDTTTPVNETDSTTSVPPSTTTAEPEMNVVATSLGRIRGKYVSVMVNWNGTNTNITGEEFLGVRYAKRPVRFAEPQALDAWTDVQNALEYGDNCPQNRESYASVSAPGRINSSEDCLYLNIFVPKGGVESLKAMNKSLPVFVYFQSGGYETMPASVYSGIVLADSGSTIVVTVNYRVGVLGFLALKDGAGSIKGNYGLLDQLQALRWIRNNIANFAGDPLNVTIAGDYKGGAHVGIHMLSTRSRDLFHRAISMSGDATAPWAYSTTTNVGDEFVKRITCNRDSYDATLACLRTKSLTNILNYEKDPSFPINLHRPVVDGEILAMSPPEILRTVGVAGDKEYVIGYSESDGSFLLKAVNVGNVTNFVYSFTRFRQLLSDVFTKYFGLTQSVEAMVQSTLFQYDIGPSTDNDVLGQRIVKLFTDVFFKAPVAMTTELYTRNGTSIFLYNFAHRSTALNPNKRGFITAELPDLPYFLFGGSLLPAISLGEYSHKIVRRDGHLPGEIDAEISQNVIAYWSNFAETGNPNTGAAQAYTTVNWPSFDNTDSRYLYLEEDPTDAQVDVNDRSVRFWNAYVRAVQQSEPTPVPPTLPPKKELDIAACRRYYAEKIGPEVSPETAAGVMWGMLAAASVLFLVCIVLAITLAIQRRRRQSYKTNSYTY